MTDRELRKIKYLTSLLELRELVNRGNEMLKQIGKDNLKNKIAEHEK